MKTPRIHIRPDLFLKAAEQRLIAAKQLSQCAQGRSRDKLYLDALYLCGYCVECSMKAVLVAQIPATDRTEFVGEYFRGADAHDFENLIALLNTRQISLPNPNRRTVSPRKKVKRFVKKKSMPAALSKNLLKRMRSMTWSTNLRYESGTREQSEFSDFLGLAEEILNWSKGAFPRPRRQ